MLSHPEVGDAKRLLAFKKKKGGGHEKFTQS